MYHSIIFIQYSAVNVSVKIVVISFQFRFKLASPNTTFVYFLKQTVRYIFLQFESWYAWTKDLLVKIFIKLDVCYQQPSSLLIVN